MRNGIPDCPTYTSVHCARAIEQGGAIQGWRVGGAYLALRVGNAARSLDSLRNIRVIKCRRVQALVANATLVSPTSLMGGHAVPFIARHELLARLLSHFACAVRLHWCT